MAESALSPEESFAGHHLLLRVSLRSDGFEPGPRGGAGGRLLRLRTLLEDGTFMVTYGDGLADIDVAALVAFHKSHGRLAPVTTVHSPARIGAMQLDGERVARFSEMHQTDVGWINGGFFVFEPGVLEYFGGDETSLEREPVERLAVNQQLMPYRHEGFWQPMDTLREKQQLEEMWQSGHAPWARPG